MLTLFSNDYEIHIRNELIYGTDPEKSTPDFGTLYNFCGDQYQPSAQHSVHVYRHGQLLKQCLLNGTNGATSVHEHSAVVHNDRILVCCGNRICSLSIPQLNLEWSLEADPATCFGVHCYNDAIIVHGELNMTRITPQGSVNWSVSGADIFTDVTGTDSLRFYDNHFEVCDFSENIYTISYDGISLKMQIRPADMRDIATLHEIRVAVRENALSNPALISPADYEEFLFQRGKGWVCEIDNVIVGFAICDLKEENIWALFVHPDFERRGVARALQKEMLDWYFTRRDKVWLGTAPGTRAEMFYRRSGWKESGMHGKEIKFEMTKNDWPLQTD